MKLLPTSFVPLGPEFWWNQRAAGKDAAMTLQITPSLSETWISDTDPNGGVDMGHGEEVRREFLYSGTWYHECFRGIEKVIEYPLGS